MPNTATALTPDDSFPHVLLIGAAFAPGGNGTAIRTSALALARSGLRPLIYDPTDSKHRDNLDFGRFARDIETSTPDFPIRLVFPRKIEAGSYVDEQRTVICALDSLPGDPTSGDPSAILSRFDALITLTHAAQAQVETVGFTSHSVGRIMQMPECFWLTRNDFELDETNAVILIPFDIDEPASESEIATTRNFIECVQQVGAVDNAIIAVMGTHALGESLGFQDQPNFKFFNLAANEYLADALLVHSDCVVSFAARSRLARTLSRAAWLQKPLFCSDGAANDELMNFANHINPDAPDLPALADRVVKQAVAERTARSAPGTLQPDGFDNFSIQSVGWRLREVIVKTHLAKTRQVQ